MPSGRPVPLMKAIPHPRFFPFLALLFCSIDGASGFMKPQGAVVAGFSIAALGFIAAGIPLFLQDQPEDLRRRGARDDGGRVFLVLAPAIVLALIRGSIRNLVFRRIRSRRHNHDPGLRRVLNDGAEPIEPGLPPIGLRARHRSHAFTRAEGAASRPSLRAGKAGGCCATF
ncbi:MAG: hypothetical protein ACK446_12955 [Rhodobacterales bacterium]|jgi:hypothetical protein